MHFHLLAKEGAASEFLAFVVGGVWVCGCGCACECVSGIMCVCALVRVQVRVRVRACMCLCALVSEAELPKRLARHFGNQLRKAASCMYRCFVDACSVFGFARGWAH